MQALAAGAFGGDLGLMDPFGGALGAGGIMDDAGYALAAVTGVVAICLGGCLANGAVALGGGVDVALVGNGVATLPVDVAVFGFGVVGICLGGGLASCVVALAGAVDVALAGNGVAGLPVDVAVSGFGMVGMAVKLDVAGTTLVALAVDVAVAGTGAGLAVGVAGTGSVAGLVVGAAVAAIGLGGCTATVAVGGAFGSVGASPCCGELALAFFLNLGVTVLLACVAGLGIEEAAGAGMSVASSAWTVSGGELGTFGPSVPAGKGTGMLSILGVLGLGGMGGWSAGLLGSVGLSMSCMVCSNHFLDAWAHMVAMQHECNAPLLWQPRWSKLGQSPTIGTNILGMMYDEGMALCGQYVYIGMYLFIYR